MSFYMQNNSVSCNSEMIVMIVNSAKKRRQDAMSAIGVVNEKIKKTTLKCVK